MQPIKSTVGRKMLALTIRHSHRNPEIIGGKTYHGRIALRKRAEHRKQLVNLLIKDKTLAEILNNPALDSEKRVPQMKQHLLARFSNADKAVKYLTRVQVQIRAAIAEERLEPLRKIAQLKKLSAQDTDAFLIETNHLIQPPSAGLLALLERTKMDLLKQ